MINFISLIINVLIGIGLFMGVFGWFWLPNMLSGNLSGPYGLLLWYVVSIPFMLGVAFIFLFLLTLYRFVMFVIMRGASDPTTLLIRNKILSLFAVVLIAGFPGYIGTFDTLQTEEFGGRYYQLLMQHTSNSASFSVFNCASAIGHWCQSELQTPRLGPPIPTPTPLSEAVIVVDNNPIHLRPLAVPTVTPPAELLVDTTGVGLLLKVGPEVVVVTTIVPTATSVGTAPPDVIVTIAPSATPAP